MTKPKLLREEIYKRPGLKIKPHCLPMLPSATGFVVTEAFILKAGLVEVDGERREYQDVRIYLKGRPAT